MEYKITKEHCRSMINGVCDGCGGELVPFETVDNAGDPTYWAGCEHCQKFCWGVPLERFKIAEVMVKEMNYIYYSHLGYKSEGDEGYQYWLESQISGACGVILKVEKAKEIVSNKKSPALTGPEMITQRTI